MSAEALVIALDGPAASGKSSIGRAVANRLGLRYFDTGLLYRALTWLALQRGVDPSDAQGLTELVGQLGTEVDAEGRVWRGGEDITPQLHQPDVDAYVSPVSAHPDVRAALIDAQRAVIKPPGVVMAGRDIGTIIVPDAHLKIWLHASPEERARRRAAQTGERYAAVLEGVQRRDRFDASRAVAPMARAADAVELETDGVPLEAVVDHVVELARARSARTESARDE